MNIGGHERIVRGNILFALADTLAAHSIGGFKVGVGFSLRKCRQCLATKEDMSTKVCMTQCKRCTHCIVVLLQSKAGEFTPRTPETYDYHCSLLDGPLGEESSTTYGINYRSCLNDLEIFM